MAASSSSGVRRLVPLTLGWVDLPKSISIEGAAPGDRLLEPVPGVLLECDGGWILLDTGFNPSLIRDPELRRRYHGDPALEPVLPGPGDPLEEALHGAGIDVDRIYAVGLSHLHYDHAGGLRYLAGRVPVHVQRAELDFGMGNDPPPEPHGVYRVDFDDPAIDWRLADGDTIIASGVRALLTAGHTPGHQSFVIDFDKSVGGGGVVLAFDAADLVENIDHELAVGTRVNAPPEQSVEAIRRLKSIAARNGYSLIPGHDPVAWPEFTDAMGARFASAGEVRRGSAP